MTEFVAEASQARFELTTYSLGGCRRVNGYYSDLSNVELTVSVSVDMDAFIPTYSARGDNSHGGCPKYFYACHFIRLFAQTQGKIRGIVEIVIRGDFMREIIVKNRLKSYRHRLELNQTEMANYLGINRDQYNRYERNQRQPTLAVALKISAKLGVTVDEIFYIADEAENV